MPIGYPLGQLDTTLPTFRIIDLRSGTIEPELHTEARSPEEAAEHVLGLQLVRAGHPRNLVCRVYWQDATTVTNMVRLYSRSMHATGRPAD